MPVVSVVLIFLDEERFIEEAVHSLRQQTLTDWELVMVDDGSTDGSTRIARELAATDDKIVYVDHPGHQNLGMSVSRNLGISLTSAPFVGFLDADDVWEPEKLAEQVELLEAMPDVAMVVGAVRHWYSWDPTATEQDFILFPGGIADRRLDPPEAALRLFPFGKQFGVAVDQLVRRSVLESVGGFEDRFRGLYEDQAFNIKVFLRHPIYISSRVWLRYRRHEGSFLWRTTRAEFVRGRREFVAWFREDEGRLRDKRVNAAVRRARREMLIERVADSLPQSLRNRIKRARAHMRGRPEARNGMRHAEPTSPSAVTRPR